MGQNSPRLLDYDLCAKKDQAHPVVIGSPVPSAQMCYCIVRACCVIRQTDSSGVASFQQCFCVFKTGHSCSSPMGQEDALGE